MYPITAAAVPSPGQPRPSVTHDDSDDSDSDSDSDDSDSDGGDSYDSFEEDQPRSTEEDRPRSTSHAGEGGSGRADHTRPMTSGEQQYRNGCRRGYITDDCEQFDVTHLLRRGIDPFV